MTRRPWRSALVAGIFALHPLHVESVAWVSERKDMLSTFFEIAALFLYTRFAASRSLARYLAVALMFGLGLMAKPMLVTFPFVLLLFDYWPLGRFAWPVRLAAVKPFLIEKVPLLTLSAIAGVLTFIAQRNYGAVATLDHFPLADRLANAVLSYVVYILQAIWPVDLGLFYPTSPPAIGLAILAAALLLAVSIAALRFAKTAPYLLTGWLWYMGMMVPVIGLVQVGAQIRADRYMYVPLVGLSLAVVWMLGDWSAHIPQFQRILAGAAGILLVAAAGRAYRQVGFWHDSRSLFEHTLAVTDHNYIIHNNLGVVLASQNDFQGAAEHYRQALALSKDYADGHANLGHELLRSNHFDEAARELREAVRLNGNLPTAHADLGILLASSGNYQEAAQHLTESLREKPGNAVNESDLCFVLAHSGRAEEALAPCKEALRMKPDFPEAHMNLGTVLQALGRTEAARNEFELARRGNPTPGH